MTNLDSILKSRDITLSTKVHLAKAMVFPVVMYGCESWTIKKLSAEELMLWTVVLEKALESPLDCKEIQPVHPKEDQSWMFIGRTDAWSWNSNTLATWCKELTHLKRPWCWERLRAGGEGDGRGWDGRMASPTQWTCIWVNSRSWWWIGRPGTLRFMGSQRVGHDRATEKQQLVFTLVFSCLELAKNWQGYILSPCLFNLYAEWKWMWSHTVVFNSLRPHGLQPIRLLHPWDFPGKITGVGCHFLLQGIFLTQGLNPGLPHCRQMLYRLEPPGKSYMQSILCKMLGWMKHKLEPRLPGEIATTWDMQMTPSLWKKAKRI